MHPRRLFISYSHTDPSHSDWVVQLATRLREDGVDVLLDKWDLKIGQDMYAFMEQMITDPTIAKVAVVCDRTYTEKANAREGGVGTEVALMAKYISEDKLQEKFLTIASEQDSSGDNYIPDYLASRLYIDFSDKKYFEERYQELLHAVYDQDYLKKPPLGKRPEHLDSANSDENPKGNEMTKKVLEDPSVSTNMLLSALWNRLGVFASESQGSESESKAKSQDAVGSNIVLLPSCFESSELILETILAQLHTIQGAGEVLPQYLGAICAAFGASDCRLIKNFDEVYDRKGDQLAQRKARELTSTYGFLFKQRISLRFDQISSPLKKNAIYLPLNLSDSSDELVISGILLSGINKQLLVDDSVSVVLSSLYASSNALTKKTDNAAIRQRVYDDLKRTYRFVSKEMYEWRYQAFLKELEHVEMHFEPIVEFSHSSKRFNIYSYEALARVGDVVPSYLFEAAELWGVQFQIALDKHILKKSLARYLALLEKNKSRSYNDIMPLSVNAYPSTILDEDYRKELYETLEDFGFPGHKLTLEISEKDVIYAGNTEAESLDAFIEAKEDLKKRRVKIAIDDFGTGNSSLLRVQKIMPDSVKIDRQILLYQPKVAKQIIGQLINIKDDSHNRLFNIIVEGLDEEAHLNITISELVNDLEVDYIQGHLLARATNDTPQRLARDKYLEIQNYLGWAS